MNTQVETGVLHTPLSFVVGLNLYIAAIYTNIAVTVGGFVVPGILGLIGAVFLARNVRNLPGLGWLVAFLTASLLLGGSGADMIGYRFPSWLQMVAALCCAHILLCGINYRLVVRKTLFAWMLFLTIGVILETVFPVVRELSEAFRLSVFDGRFIYDNDVRDLREYGLVRPKLFTQEPSHISKAFVVFGAGWYLLAQKRFTVLLVCTLSMTVFLRSPFVLLALPLAWFLDRMASDKPVSRVFIAAIPILGVFAVLATQVFSTRFTSIVSGRDFSFFSRYEGPYRVAADTLGQYPVFGVGIGAKEALWGAMRLAYAPYVDDSTYFREVWLQYFNNAFANSLMFFGLIGAGVFYWLVARWFNGFGIRVVALPVVLLFFQLEGALEGIRLWSAITLVLGCYMLRKNNPVDTGTRVDQRPIHHAGREIGLPRHLSRQSGRHAKL